MRSKLFATAVLAFTLLAFSVSAGELGWFDMEHCDMCKSYMAHPDMMKSMSWDQKKVSNGILCIETVPQKYLADYREAYAACSALGDKIMAGEKATLCGSCTAFGALTAKGAKIEPIELSNGGGMLVTSDDPALVKELHEWVDKNNAEMQKMMAAEAEK